MPDKISHKLYDIKLENVQFSNMYKDADILCDHH